MTIENDPSARMQFVGMGELTHPGNCMVCGNGGCEEGYVRLGVYYEYEGEMYLCLACVTQASELIGCLTSEESDLLRSQTLSLATDLQITTEELEKANERLTAYDTILAGIGATTDASRDATSDSSGEEPAGTDATDEESVEGPAVTVPEPAEPVTQPRRGNPSKPAKPNRSNQVSI